MFSGLIETTTQILGLLTEPGGVRIVLKRPHLFDDVRLGDSIAIQGCCLTIVEISATEIAFQAGRETLSRTTLGQFAKGALVNCERSLRLGDRIGGHLVTGHIDGTGTVFSRKNQAQWSDIIFSAPSHLMGQMVSKGSITVDGVSLTLVDVDDHTFSVALIPHTLSNTTLGELKVGESVNLETDLLAKYVERQLGFADRNGSSKSK